MLLFADVFTTKAELSSPCRTSEKSKRPNRRTAPAVRLVLMTHDRHNLYLLAQCTSGHSAAGNKMRDSASFNTCTYVCQYMNTYICPHTLVHVFVFKLEQFYIHSYILMCISVNVDVHIHIYIYMYICISICTCHVYIHMCIYTCIYTFV